MGATLATIAIYTMTIVGTVLIGMLIYAALTEKSRRTA
jgi:hypothetical protein